MFDPAKTAALASGVEDLRKLVTDFAAMSARPKPPPPAFVPQTVEELMLEQARERLAAVRHRLAVKALLGLDRHQQVLLEHIRKLTENAGGAADFEERERKWRWS